MAVVLKDRVQETTGVVGTGTMTLAGAVVGFQAFSSVGTGSTVYYSITNAADGTWEVGSGTYTLSGTTLSRDTVYSSSAAGAKVSFAAGTKQVFCTYPASQSIYQASADNYPISRPTLLLDFANTKVLDPRITFTRASTGAYYDGKTTALAEQNLLLQSQTFGTTWVTTNGTLITGITAPDTTTTATTLTATSANATVYQTLTLSALPYTFSLYIQRVLGTGTINLTLDGTTLTPQTITTSWVRYVITATPAAGARTIGIQVTTLTDSVNIWGAQLEQRSSVTAYNVTTTAAITNYIPVLLTAASGAARFDSNPITGESLGLLIEEQRTNLLTYSEQFDNAIYSSSAASRTANQAISPDGSVTADLIKAAAVPFGGLVRTNYAYVANTAYTMSVYAKAGTTNFIGVRPSGQCVTGSDTYCFFNLATGVATAITPLSGVVNAVGMVSVGNGWYRCFVTYTSPATAPQSTTDFAITSSSGSTNNVPAGTETVYLWGAQLEAGSYGSYATSYIPTVASQVTRAADSASMTGTNFSSWYNAGQGSFYTNFDILTTATLITRELIGFDTASGNNARFFLGIAWGGSSYSACAWGMYTSDFSGSNVNLSTGFQKIVGTYGNGSITGVANGGTVYTTTNTNPSPSTVYFGQDFSGVHILNGHFKRIAYYPQALTATQLQALTS